MSEDEWFEKVEEILSNMGMDLDHQNDGWQFMFENGWSPLQVITEMTNV